MRKSPAFQLYAKDALADTLHLCPEAFTAYWRLVFQAWIGVDDAPQGHLPQANDAALRSMTALTPAQWRKAKAATLRLFRSDDNGGRYHKRLVEELEKQTSTRAARSTAGKAGANAKQERSKREAIGEASWSTKSSSASASASAPAGKSKNQGEDTLVAQRSTRPGIPPEILAAIPDFGEIWAERMRTPGRGKKPTPSAEGHQLRSLVKLLGERGAEAVVSCVAAATHGGYQGLPTDRFTNAGGARRSRMAGPSFADQPAGQESDRTFCVGLLEGHLETPLQGELLTALHGWCKRFGVEPTREGLDRLMSTTTAGTTG
jgi:uncharacterized protein YdaU (DUF1376 family)